MLNGLWSGRFEAMGKSGAGVAVFVGGKILGGDSAFIWSGTYQEQGEKLTTDIHVKRYDLSMESIFGVNEYNLHVDAKIEGDKITGTGTSPALHGIKLNVTLIKRVGV
jgi:T3SS negative regulator,GrlR